MSQESYPDVWACESEQKHVRVDVKADISEVEPDIDTVETFIGPLGRDDINARIYIENGALLESVTFSFIYDDREGISRVNEKTFTEFFSDENGVYVEYVEILFPELRQAFEDNTFEYHIDNYELIEEDSSWIEIPTASVELWETRDNAAAINRTANVVFPNSWGQEEGNVTNSPLDIINEASSDDPIQQGRVLFRDDADSDWIIKHLGFISGVGGTDNPLESQMWIYDYSQLISNAPLTATYNDENAKRVVTDIAGRIRNETPTPLSDLHIRLEDAQQPLESDFDSEQDLIVGENTFRSNNNHTEVMSDDLYDLTNVLSNGIRLATIDGPIYEFYTGDYQDISETPSELLQLGSDFVNVSLDVFNLDQKHFTRNRDTIGDAMDWFTKNVSAQWWFEPLPNGNSLALIIDIDIVRQTYCDVNGYEELRDIVGATRLRRLQNGVTGVRVMENRALDEINPINTLRLNGSTGKSFKGELFEGDIVPAARSLVGQPATNTYPYVKVRATNLYEAADEHEIQPNVIDSDVESKAAAEGEAKKELLERLTRPTDGEIELYGSATMRPYDTLYAYQTCGDYIDTTQPLISYTVAEVKHEQKGGGTYRTKVTPSLRITSGDIQIVESEMQNINT